jgi:hypothetical protein
MLEGCRGYSQKLLETLKGAGDWNRAHHLRKATVDHDRFVTESTIWFR